jgi:hypothetical protein
MADFVIIYDFVRDWYAWVIGAPGFALVMKYLWKRRAGIKEWALFWWNARKNLTEVKQDGARIRNCPNCDVRMKVTDTKVASSRSLDIWWYACPTCNQRFTHSFKAK